MKLDPQIIKKSFESAKPIANELVDYFYQTLFKDYPDSKSLFNDVNMDKQKKALITSLVFIVDNVDNPKNLIPYLEKMGGRHVSYGVDNRHYDWVGASLIRTFQYFFDENWTEELEKQWILAYTVIAETMKKGAEKVSKTPITNSDPIKEKAHSLCLNLLSESLEDCIDQKFKENARVKVRELLLKILDEESKNLTKKVS